MPGVEPINEPKPAEPWDRRMLAAIQGGAKEHPERPARPWPVLFHLPFAGLSIAAGSWSSAWIVPLLCLWAVALAFGRLRTRRGRAGSARRDAFGR